MMKYLLVLATLGTLGLLSGCCASGCLNGDGVAYTRKERANRYQEIIRNDCQQMTDDWDTFWLMDQKTHLSKWNIE